MIVSSEGFERAAGKCEIAKAMIVGEIPEEEKEVLRRFFRGYLNFSGTISKGYLSSENSSEAMVVNLPPDVRARNAIRNGGFKDGLYSGEAKIMAFMSAVLGDDTFRRANEKGDSDWIVRWFKSVRDDEEGPVLSRPDDAFFKAIAKDLAEEDEEPEDDYEPGDEDDYEIGGEYGHEF